MAALTAEFERDAVALTLTSITKRFGDTVALDGASLTVRAGTVHALLGENGAGKTTLMRIAFGLLTPDAGTLFINRIPQQFASPRDAIQTGIGMVHQHFMLVPAMTVTENIALGGSGPYRAEHLGERIRNIGAQHGLPIDPDAKVGSLSIGAQQRVEIVKALTRGARLLILDEPTAVLAPSEARSLLITIRSFVANGGTVVLITHKLRDALEFADDVTVLRKGRTVYTAESHATNEATLATAMLGQAISDETREHAPSVKKYKEHHAILALRDVSVSDHQGILKLANATLRVHAGEIVGVAAVEGNGQYELLRVLARHMDPTTGTIQAPSDVGFIPEDRHRDALLLDFPLYENVALAGVGVRHGTIHWGEERERTAQLMRLYDVRAASPAVEARALSGGNQQKLVVGREITTAPNALVAENPTRGLDIQATAAVHERLREASNRGTAIVVYSSDVDELLTLAHRIIVLYNGAILEVPHDRDVVGNAMIGRQI